MKALVVIPTHNHGATLAIALQWLTRQSHADFEAVVIGDGVPEALMPLLRDLAASDARFHFEFHPKHARRGEPYRDAAIRASDADFVCYLADRDIWFDDHLAQMAALLSEADYAHSLGVHVLPDGALRAYACDLTQPGYRHMLLTTNDNRMPFSTFGHRRDAYLKLSEGWSTTPEKEWTDLYMIRKFLCRTDLRGASGVMPTAVTFPSPPRIDWSSDRRTDELREWSDRLSDVRARERLRLAMLQESLIVQRRETAQLAEMLAIAAAPPSSARSFSSASSYRSLNVYGRA